MAQKILIIGAGVGGLTLAQALHKNSIPFHIFERDPSISHRAQGYRIRISGDGVHALHKCLPAPVWDTLEASAASGIIGLARLDAMTGEEVPMGGPGGPGGPGSSPSKAGRVGVDSNGEVRGMRTDATPIAVDRTLMRQVLLTNLSACISFGKTFHHYEVTDSGITAHFADGTSHTGAFLVGADGANSLVRKQYLPSLKVVDTKGRCIFGKTYITPELEQQFTKKAHNGMTLVQEKLEDGTPLTLFLEATRFPNPEIVTVLDTETGKEEKVKDYIYWVLLSKQHIFNQPTVGSTVKPAALAIQLTQNWHASITPLLHLQHASSTSMLKILCAEPNVLSWKPSSRITLLGDAAHPMPPTAGLGALSALRDADRLVDVLMEGPSEESVGVYEEEMRRWAKSVIEEVKKGSGKFFGGWEWDAVEAV